MTRIVVVGATSAIAWHCARLWAMRGPTRFVLVGRDAARLQRVAADLVARGGPAVHAEVETVDFESPTAIGALVERVAREPVDVVLVAHGVLPDEAARNDLAHAARTLGVNAVSPVLFAEAFAAAMQAAGRGKLVLLGSVAGDRGRKSNYLYGAAKGLVDRYAQGLQHRLASTAVRVTLVKPGPTATPMTAALQQQGLRTAPVEVVARRIVSAVDAGRAVVYAPARWRWIMLVLRHLPAPLFNRLDI